jgi:signal transduction histidine kinase
VQFFVKSVTQNDDIAFYNVETGPTQTLVKIPFSHSIVQLIMRTKNTILKSNSSVHALILESLLAFACIPIFRHDQLVGFMLLDRKKTLSSYSFEDVTLFNDLSKEIGIVIERLKPYEEVEESLKRSLEIAEKAENEASYARLTRGIAHEIRNPLGILLSAFELIVEKADEPQEATKLVEIAKSTILRLTNVTSTMLKYGNPVSSKKEPTDISVLIKDLATVCQGELKKRRITLTPTFSNTPPIIVDPVSINQAFLNIILNSIHSIESDGEILINTSLDTFLSPQTNTQTHALKITIHDTGKGISEDHLDQIFDPFFSTKHTSAGLGLSIVRKIIHEHQGTIKIQAKVNEYATVSIYLPLISKDQID